MARILYGVSGEGLGHAARSKEVVDYLTAAGHEVVLASYDRGRDNLAEFYPVEAINGIVFTYENNQLKYLKTTFRNFLTSGATIKSLDKLSKLVDRRHIDLVICDYEPLTAFMAHLKHLPLISLDNQHAITKTDLGYPKNYRRDYLVFRMVTRLIMWRASAYVVLSFAPCQPDNNKVFIFPPVIKKEVLAAKPTVGDKILVYLNSRFSGIVDILKDQPAEFIIYGLGREGRDGNLTFRLVERSSFEAELAACRAVIGTAGFALMSEALYLGKPFLSLPAQHQFEQLVNAYHLARLGYGEHHDHLTRQAVADFLPKIEDYRQRLAGAVLSGNQAVFDKVEELIKLYVR
jgi:uncharacterized protein (TIGR00661 family)